MPLTLDEIRPDELAPERFDLTFLHTLERLDSQGHAIEQGSLKIVLETRPLPEPLARELRERVPEHFKDNFLGLIVLPGI